MINQNIHNQYDQKENKPRRAPSSNMKAQFLQAILKCCKFGESKHEIKLGTENNGNGFMPSVPWIYSDNHKEGLKDFAKQMATFMKENYPEIKEAVRIKVKHWNVFLEVKAVTCSTATLETYCSYIKKLQLCIKQHFNPRYPINWKKGLLQPDSMKTPSGELLRVQQMSPEDFNKIMEHAQRSGTRSRAPIAWELSKRLGLRVAELAIICKKNIHLDKPGRWTYGYVDIVGKGKRYRKINIKTQEDRDYLIKVTVNIHPDDKVIGVCKQHINQQLRRAMTDLNMKEKYPYTGVHSCRKLYAQETFSWVKKEHNFTEIQAIRYVNNQLGHSEDRSIELIAIYVKEIKKNLDEGKAKRKFHES